MAVQLPLSSSSLGQGRKRRRRRRKDCHPSSSSSPSSSGRSQFLFVSFVFKGGGGGGGKNMPLVEEEGVWDPTNPTFPSSPSVGMCLLGTAAAVPFASSCDCPFPFPRDFCEEGERTKKFFFPENIFLVWETRGLGWGRGSEMGVCVCKERYTHSRARIATSK